jgi:hypothetical protein
MKYILLFVTLTFLGCSNSYEECVNQKQKVWRESNPNADYAKSSAANEKFRKECGNYKKK